MKRKTRIRINKVVSTLLTLALVLCQVCFLSACGKEDVERNKTRIEEELPDNMDASDVADMLESGMSVDEIVDKVEEIKEEEVTTDKPAEATASPEPTATASPSPEPTSTPSPAPTATPEPHVHEYVETVTRQPSCATTGEKQLVCQGCGDVKVEAIPATGEHNWVEGTTAVHHEELGHVESVIVGYGDTRHEYECKYCGFRADTAAEVSDHCVNSGNIDHAFSGTIIHDIPGEPIYESQWVVDQNSWDETVGNGVFTCQTCGATK